MTVRVDSPQPSAAPPNRLALLKDIRTKWMKLTEAEVLLLTSRDALVALVEERYGRTLLLSDVDSVLKGRSF